MNVIRRLGGDEFGIIRPLFESVFGQPISQDLLDWKYAGGRGESWAALSGDRVPILHCGVWFRNVLDAGEPVRAAQLVDLMAAPKLSGLTRTTSPFTQLMRSILATLPCEENQDGIAFGFPSDRAMRLGEHVGVYRSVGNISKLTFAPNERRVSFSLYDRLDAIGDDIIERLWQKMSVDFVDHVIGIRDAEYLMQRYSRHPEKRYQFLLSCSRFTRRPLGLAVVRSDSQRVELLDIVGPRKAFPEILATCRHWMAQSNKQGATMLLSEPFATQMTAMSDRHEATEFRIMANPFSPASTLSSLNNRWWLTGGDTDYR